MFMENNAMKSYLEKQKIGKKMRRQSGTTMTRQSSLYTKYMSEAK